MVINYNDFVYHYGCHLSSVHWRKPRANCIYTSFKVLWSQGPHNGACGITIRGLFEMLSVVFIQVSLGVLELLHSGDQVGSHSWIHDDVIKWKHFPRYWPFVRGINRSPVNSPHKGQWTGALMFSFICVWTNAWVNNHKAGDLRRHRVHYDVIVMSQYGVTVTTVFRNAIF